MTKRADKYTLNSKFSDVLMEVLLEPENWELTRKEITKICVKLARKAKIRSGPSEGTVTRLLTSPEFRRELREAREDRIYRALPSMEHAMIREATEGNVQAYDRMKDKVKERFDGEEGGLAAIPDEDLDALVRHFIKKGD